MVGIPSQPLLEEGTTICIGSSPRVCYTRCSGSTESVVQKLISSPIKRKNIMYSKTPIETLTKKQVKKIVKFCANWCYENMGVNNRKRSGLTYSFGKEEDGFYGFYCPINNHIRVSLTECKTVGRLTSTFIHEYTHYLQPVRTKYASALVKHGYWDNPFEVEARMMEKKLNRYLLSDLRAKM